MGIRTELVDLRLDLDDLLGVKAAQEEGDHGGEEVLVVIAHRGEQAATVAVLRHELGEVVPEGVWEGSERIARNAHLTMFRAEAGCLSMMAQEDVTSCFSAGVRVTESSGRALAESWARLELRKKIPDYKAIREIRRKSEETLRLVISGCESLPSGVDGWSVDWAREEEFEAEEGAHIAGTARARERSSGEMHQRHGAASLHGARVGEGDHLVGRALRELSEGEKGAQLSGSGPALVRPFGLMELLKRSLSCSALIRSAP